MGYAKLIAVGVVGALLLSAVATRFDAPTDPPADICAVQPPPMLRIFV